MAFKLETLPDGRRRAYDEGRPGVEGIGATQAEAVDQAQAAASKFERLIRTDEPGPLWTGTVPRGPVGAAAYLGVLAYPDDVECADKFVEAFMAWYLKGCVKAGTARRKDCKPYSAFRNRDIERALRDGVERRILHRRLPVVHALFPRLLHFSNTGPESMTPMFRSIARQRSAWGHVDAVPLADSIDAQADHAAKVWKETKPVLHLAMALSEALGSLLQSAAERERAMGHGFPSEELFSVTTLFYEWKEWFEPAIEHAEELRRIWTGATGWFPPARSVAEYYRLKLKESETIQLRLQPDG